MFIENKVGSRFLIQMPNFPTKSPSVSPQCSELSSPPSLSRAHDQCLFLTAIPLQLGFKSFHLSTEGHYLLLFHVASKPLSHYDHSMQGRLPSV